MYVRIDMGRSNVNLMLYNLNKNCIVSIFNQEEYNKLVYKKKILGFSINGYENVDINGNYIVDNRICCIRDNYVLVYNKDTQFVEVYNIYLSEGKYCALDLISKVPEIYYIGYDVYFSSTCLKAEILRSESRCFVYKTKQINFTIENVDLLLLKVKLLEVNK